MTNQVKGVFKVVNETISSINAEGEGFQKHFSLERKTNLLKTDGVDDLGGNSSFEHTQQGYFTNNKLNSTKIK